MGPKDSIQRSVLRHSTKQKKAPISVGSTSSIIRGAGPRKDTWFNPRCWALSTQNLESAASRSAPIPIGRTERTERRVHGESRRLFSPDPGGPGKNIESRRDVACSSSHPGKNIELDRASRACQKEMMEAAPGGLTAPRGQGCRRVPDVGALEIESQWWVR